MSVRDCVCECVCVCVLGRGCICAGTLSVRHTDPLLIKVVMETPKGFSARRLFRSRFSLTNYSSKKKEEDLILDIQSDKSTS